MRTALLLVVLLVLAGAWLVHCEVAPSNDFEQVGHVLVDEAPWVRTQSGWERATWMVRRPSYAPRLHPLTIALLLGFSSSIALLVGPAQNSRIEK